ncbi:MAG: 3-hydroxyacyl-CoA dehydrogenase NAD-binding domain-containing protein [Planctomycetes bacterium]|nr:3-hydroxyacyl-CoA dehydrogenase NAD-binding domain-containing protein [Planctomycetota bacterium]
MAATTTFSLSFPEADVALLTLDDPQSGANVLSRHVLDALEQHLNELDKRKGLAGLVIYSAKPGMFIAGADLKEFATWLDAPKAEVSGYCRRGQQLFGRLARGNYVTVAAIDGMCVGGGAEVALWCDRRVLTDGEKTAFGFPEVKLGLFPGWGGTARSPRIVGLSNAIELVTGGENIDARAAAAMGLANDVVALGSTEPSPTPSLRGRENNGDALLAAAIRMVRAEQATQQFRRDREQWAAPIAISDTELGFLGATASAYIQQQTKGHYPAPLAALEVMLGAAGADVETACKMEAEEFAKLFGSPVNRALLNVFFLQDRNKKSSSEPGRPRPRGDEPHKITSAGVVGAGIMGQGIAAANVKRGIPVALMDANQEALARGVKGVLNEVAYNKQLKGLDVQRAVDFAPLVNGTLSDIELCHSDIVVEAIIENREAKRHLFARLEPLMRDDAVLASNTSTIPITQLAEGLERPERFCGLHFFNPVRQMPLVEVIRGKRTSDETIATAAAYARALGKSPIVMNDGPGFLVNRLLLPYMNEAALMLCEGADLQKIEKAAKSFGMPMGPFTLYDVVGLDVAVHAGRTMAEAFPDRVVPAQIVRQLVDRGRLGQKAGKGFFDYGPAKAGKPPRGADSEEVAKLIDQCRAGGAQKFSSEQITDRLFLPMLVEATRVLEDRIVSDVRDVDLGLILGIGFPPFLGGLFFWADQTGAAKIVEKLKQYSPLGKRYKPTAMLTKLAERRSRFYDYVFTTETQRTQRGNEDSKIEC